MKKNYSSITQTFAMLIQKIIFLKTCLNLKEVVFQQKKYLPCDELLPTTKFKTIHDFLKNYPDGKFDPFEDRPIDIKYSGNITFYEITVSKHADYFNCCYQMWFFY